MENFKIKQTIIFFVISAFFFLPGMAQDDCKVLMENIAGKYEGDCKKGLAEGRGTASGTDTYVGDFKKGLPHGTGKYTWAAGDVYEGEFSKGKKEGKGTLNTRLPDGSMTRQEGYWKGDEYIGEFKTPYEVLYRTSGVLSVRISEAENPANDGNALFIELQHKGRTQPAPNFGLNVVNGNFQNQFLVGNTMKVIVTNFPFGFTLSYMGESVEIQIYQARTWNIRIDFNK
ncbi:MAG: hypothetical protein KFF73_13805 [Cyclobacteriaceae bacterium]|nr:hypothetical protein [Cyclobacteriaceae bacterium]